MAALLEVFNARLHEPKQGGSSLPIGKHPVVITASEIVGNKANTGGMLVLTLQIIDGPNRGEEGNYRLNLYNANESAARIAKQQLSAICHVIQTFDVQDSAILHNKPFIIEVGNQKYTAEQQEQVNAGQAVTPYTEVKKVFDMNGTEPLKMAQGGAAAASNAAAFQQPQQQQQAAQAPVQQPAQAAQQPAWAQTAAAPAQQPQQAAAAPAQAAWGQTNGAAAAAPAGAAPWGAPR